VVDGVAEEVLEKLLDPLGVCLAVEVPLQREGGVPEFGGGPAVIEEIGQRDARGLPDGLALSGVREDVVDEGVHAVERRQGGFEVRAAPRLAGELEPRRGHVERVPEVV